MLYILINVYTIYTDTSLADYKPRSWSCCWYTIYTVQAQYSRLCHISSCFRCNGCKGNLTLKCLYRECLAITTERWSTEREVWFQNNVKKGSELTIGIFLLCLRFPVFVLKKVMFLNIESQMETINFLLIRCCVQNRFIRLFKEVFKWFT
jgi:hypothetical protein